MKKLLVLCVALGCVTFACAQEDNLHEMFKGSSGIKVFLKDVVNETGNAEVSTDTFKKVFKDSLEKRVEMKFVPVNDEKSADAVINAKIKKYAFVEKAFPMFLSTSALAADTMSPKSSGTVVVDYEVRSPSGEKVLLAFKNFSTEERRPRQDMKGEMGYTYSIGKNIDRFIFRAFYPPKAK